MEIILINSLKLGKVERSTKESYSMPEVIESISDLTLADIHEVSSDISKGARKETRTKSNDIKIVRD